MLPQPPEEAPLAASLLEQERPHATPRIRRFLWVSGWSIVATALLNVLLFRQDGLDVFALGYLAGCVPCFLYQRFWPVMRIVSWFWVALTLPFWGVTAPKFSFRITRPTREKRPDDPP